MCVLCGPLLCVLESSQIDWGHGLSIAPPTLFVSFGVQVSFLTRRLRFG